MGKGKGMAETTLGKYVGSRGKSIEPAKQPNDWFELYSVPSHPTGLPEIVMGSQIGSNKQVVEPGSVLLCKINPRINRTWVVGAHSENPKIASTEWIVFPPSEDYEPKFLAYYLQQETIRSFLATNASGVGGSLMRVKPSTLSSFPFLLPSSLATQREIVAKLDEQFSRLDAGVAALRRAQANLNRYRASVLKAACEGRLVPTEAELAREEVRRAMEERGEWKPGMDSSLIPLPSSFESGPQLLTRILEERRTSWTGKGKYKAPPPPDTTNLPELPEGWTWATPAQLGDVQLGRQRSPKNISNEYPTKYIRAANITAQGLDLSDVLEMEFRPAERERFTLKPGDLVLSEASGSAAQVGKPALWEEHHPPHCFQNTVIRLRPSMSLVPKYLLVVFKHYYVNGVFSRVAGGVGINHLSADKFASLALALPPLAEQERIVADVERRLSVVAALEFACSADVHRATALKRSLLQATFPRSDTK